MAYEKVNQFLLNCASLNIYPDKAMAPHSSTPAWKIPWMEEPGRLQSMGSLRVGHDWATFTFPFHVLEEEMATHSSVLAWRIPGMGEPGGLPSLGSHRFGHDWSNLAAANIYHGATLVAQRLKHLRETRLRSLGREDPLEKEIVTHSSILACSRTRRSDFTLFSFLNIYHRLVKLGFIACI